MAVRLLAKILALFLLLTASCLSQAWAVTPYTISKHETGQALGLHFEILADPTHKLRFTDILRMDKAFRPSTEAIPNHGMNRSKQWFRFHLENPFDHPVQILLEDDFTFGDQLQIHYQDTSGAWAMKEAGDQLPFFTRDVQTRQPVFRFTLAPGLHQFYMLSFAEGGHQTPLYIWTHDEFFSHNALEYSYIGILIGFHVVIVFYNIFLFLTLRDITFFYYVLYVTSNVAYQAASVGVLPHALSTIGFKGYVSNALILAGADMICIASLLFSYHFLNIPQRLPKFRPYFFAICILDVLNIFYTHLGSVWVGTIICMSTASLTTTLLLSSGFLIARSGYVPAYFYLLGWGSYLMGVAGSITNLIGLAPTTDFSRWGQFTGGAVEIAILSLALGSRINTKRRETMNMIKQLNLELEDKVKERTAEINSLLLHIPQGILSIDPGGTINPLYSAQLSSILGYESIGGASFRDIILDRSTLSPDVRDQIWQSILASVGEHSLTFELNIDKLPSQLTYEWNGTKKELKLTWNSELNALDEVKHILVTLLDVTSEVAAQHEVERQNQEFEIIKQLVEIGGKKSTQFFNSGDQLMKENEHLVQDPSLNMDAIRILFVNTHTLKGAARSLNLKDLANEYHRIESCYARILSKKQPIDPAQVQEEFKEAQATYQRYLKAHRETLGRQDTLKQVPMDRGMLQEHIRFLHQLTQWELMPMAWKSALSSQCHYMTGLVFNNLAICIRDFKAQADKIAKDLDREPPMLHVEGPDILISYSQELVLKNCLIHLLRNALDHGIESGSVRQQKGKPVYGTLKVRLTEEQGHIVIDFQDDGKGLDIGKIRELTARMNPDALPRAPHALAEFIFEAGFSTTEKVSMISGRGVGLNAVRQFIEGEHGTSHVILGRRLEGPGELYEFMIRMTLPSIMDSSQHQPPHQSAG